MPWTVGDGCAGLVLWTVGDGCAGWVLWTMGDVHSWRYCVIAMEAGINQQIFLVPAHPGRRGTEP